MSTEPICPRPSVLTGVVRQSQPSVGREGTNRVRWPVSKKSISTKTILLMYVSLLFDVRQGKRLGGLVKNGQPYFSYVSYANLK